MSGKMSVLSSEQYMMRRKRTEDEEKLLKLLQGMKPQDGFTTWCEQMLHTLNTSANNSSSSLDGRSHSPCRQCPLPPYGRLLSGLKYGSALVPMFSELLIPSPLFYCEVATIVAYLKEVESPYAVLDFIRSYLGDTVEAKEFAKQFLERRAKQKANQQRQQQQVSWN